MANCQATISSARGRRALLDILKHSFCVRFGSQRGPMGIIPRPFLNRTACGDSVMAHPSEQEMKRHLLIAQHLGTPRPLISWWRSRYRMHPTHFVRLLQRCETLRGAIRVFVVLVGVMYQRQTSKGTLQL